MWPDASHPTIVNDTAASTSKTNKRFISSPFANRGATKTVLPRCMRHLSKAWAAKAVEVEAKPSITILVKMAENPLFVPRQ
jgi:hypothetical protein